jgi:hypothetical protein
MAKYPKDKRPLPTPKARRSWEAPEPPKQGDQKADTLYSAIGLALSNWSRLENTMAHIFISLVSDNDSEPAARAFGSVMTFRGRIEMIESAAEAYFFLYPEDFGIKKRLADWLDEAAKFSARRNEIAHGIVQENTRPIHSLHLEHHIAAMHTTVPHISPKYPLGFVLRPTEATTNKTQMQKGRTLFIPVNYVPDYVYSSVEVLAFAEHFERLRQLASRFALAIYGHRIKMKEQASL